MSRIPDLTSAEKKFLEEAVFAAERAGGGRLAGDKKKTVQDQARRQILSAREARDAVGARDAERMDKEFTWSKPQPYRR